MHAAARWSGFLRGLPHCLVFAVLCLPPTVRAADAAAYLAGLIREAREVGLAGRREWRVLLHYQPRTVFGGVKSLVDDPGFFAAPDGATNPEAELEATLAGFFEKGRNDSAYVHPQCRFPARYAWLKKQLGFDAARLPEQPCSELRGWLSEFESAGLTLVFATAYLENPGSMFGHTLLRLDRPGQDEPSRLLAGTISYAAMTGDEPPGLTYSLKGLFGGFTGQFSTEPYARKVKEYGDIENRDLWEYRLALTPAEIRRLLTHFRELQDARFDYYFLDENCAYQLLSLLEAARPGLDLTRRFASWAIPADTVRAVMEQPGVLHEVAYRPARSRTLWERYQRLGAASTDSAFALAAGELAPDDLAIRHLPDPERAKILEFAAELVAYRKGSGALGAGEADRLRHALLRARNRLKVPSQAPQIEPAKTRPDQGHRSARAGLGYGIDAERQFTEFEVRPAYHDLLDPEGGYPPGAEIRLMDLALRVYPKDARFELNRLRLIDVASLSPWNPITGPVSWRLGAGGEQRWFDDGGRAFVGEFGAGAGMSHAPFTNTLVYLLAEGQVELADRFESFYAVGLGPSAGLLWDVTPRWRMKLSAEWRHYFLGQSHEAYAIALNQRYALTEQSALRFRLSQSREFGRSPFSAGLSLQIYF